MANIVKHSFIKGPKIASRAAAHLNYICHRPGEDKERAAEERGADDESNRRASRILHVAGIEEDPNNPGKAAQDFNNAFWDKDERGRVIHKFILSPSADNVDMKAYTHEVMDSIARQKGQDLKYAFVVHDNTDNRHSHVIVLGKDAEGHDVRFGRNDYAYMKHFGDRYLEREHGHDLEFSKEIEMLARVQGHNLYLDSAERNLEFLQKPPKERSYQVDEDFRHLLNINRNWNEGLDGPSREYGLSLGSTWLHDRGRLVEVHDIFQNTENRELWKDVHANSTDQELRDYAEGKLAELETQRQETILELQSKLGLNPENFDGFIRSIQREFAIENQEIDMVLFPEKYEPQHFDRKEIDLSKVDSQDKIALSSGETITKFDTAQHLEGIRLQLKGRTLDWLPSQEYSKLCSWIGTKEMRGDDCFGKPPLRELVEADRGLDVDKLAAERPVSFDEINAEMAKDSREINDLLKPQEPELAKLETSHTVSIQDALDARQPDPARLKESLDLVANHDGPEINPAEIERSINEPTKDIEIDLTELKGELEPERETRELDYQIDVDDSYYDEADLDFEPDKNIEREDEESASEEKQTGEEQDGTEQTDQSQQDDIEPELDIEQNGGLGYELGDEAERIEGQTRGMDSEEQAPKREDQGR